MAELGKRIKELFEENNREISGYFTTEELAEKVGIPEETELYFKKGVLYGESEPLFVSTDVGYNYNYVD